MKKITFTICFFVLIKVIIAQDIIITKDGTRIKSKILTTSITEIKYKNFFDLEGPTYTLSMKEVKSFTYEEKKQSENTNTDVITQPVITQQEKPIQSNQGSNNSQNVTTNGTDVVYLKNGNIVRGVILEQDIKNSLKIQTADNSVFVFKMEDIEKITKEAIPIITTTTQNSGSLISSPVNQQGGTIYLQNKNYYRNGNALNSAQLRELLINNQASSGEYKKYKSVRSTGTALTTVGAVIDCAGLILILAGRTVTVDSWGLTHYEYNSEITTPGFIVAGAGTVICIVGLIVEGGGKKHLKSAVQQYNTSSERASFHPVRFSFTSDSYGLGIAMKF